MCVCTCGMNIKQENTPDSRNALRCKTNISSVAKNSFTIENSYNRSQNRRFSKYVIHTNIIYICYTTTTTTIIHMYPHSNILRSNVNVFSTIYCIRVKLFLF